MNINITAAAAKKRKSRKSKLNPSHKSIFSNDDDSSSDEKDVAGVQANTALDRHNVNRKLVAEQTAIRKRAKMAIDSSTPADLDLFDYDGQYESFSSGYQKEKSLGEGSNMKETQHVEKKQSRYIENLLREAKIRQHRREIVMERKIAKEQAEEEYVGKEKFVTQTYKRKLAEREAWEKEEKERSKRDDIEDVTKKKDGGAVVAGFYGNLSQIATGINNRPCVTDGAKNLELQNHGHDRNCTSVESLGTFHKITSNNPIATKSSSKSTISTQDSQDHEDANMNLINEELKEQSKQAERIQKVLSARERYLNRIEASVVT